MNWESAAAIAQIISALGVIASLAYLAVQIRQNTAASRGAAYHQAVTGNQAHWGPIALDADTSEIVRRGLLDLSCLNEAERFRFSWIFGGYLTSMENAFYQITHGVVPQDRRVILQAQIRWFLASPGFRAWWESYPKGLLGAEFIAEVASELEKLDAAAR